MAFFNRLPVPSSASSAALATLVAIACIGLTRPGAVVAELSPATSTALLEALADERKAEAYYQAVIERFGDVKPFTSIVAAERRHAQAIEKLCRKYAIDIPKAGAEKVDNVPTTVKEACAGAVAAEKSNIGLYDAFLAKVTEPDVRRTFEQLQRVSKNQHLPAFTRCAKGGGQGSGQANGRGAAANSEAGSCGECGMGAACGCSQASEAEKKARAAAGGGCGCAKRAAQGQ